MSNEPKDAMTNDESALLHHAENTIDDYGCEYHEWALAVLEFANTHMPELSRASVYAVVGTAVWNRGQGGTAKAHLMLDLLWSLAEDEPIQVPVWQELSDEPVIA